jgi:hypothetical protein
VFQGSVIALQFLATKAADAQHLTRYSVFMALPSATLRAMATRTRPVRTWTWGLWLQGRLWDRRCPGPQHRPTARPGRTLSLAPLSPPPKQVDDEAQEELDEDEMGAGGIGGATSTTGGGLTLGGASLADPGAASVAALGRGGDKPKSVRMAKGEEGEDGGGDGDGDAGEGAGPGRERAGGGGACWVPSRRVPASALAAPRRARSAPARRRRL